MNGFANSWIPYSGTRVARSIRSHSRHLGAVIGGLLISASLAVATPLLSGSNSPGSIASPHEQDRWTFSARTGDGIIASIAEVPGPTTEEDFRPQIQLYAPSGKYVTYVAGVQAGHFNLSAPETGEYTLVVSDGTFNRPGDKTGDYVVRLVSVPAESYVPAGDEGGRLVSGENHRGRIDLGDLDSWKFSANQGDGIIASIAEVPGPTTGDDFRPQILLYAPSGKYVTFVAGAQVGQFNLAAPETGEYTLVVSDGTFNRPGDKTGDYVVRLVSVPAESYVPAGDEGGRLVSGENHRGRIDLGDLDSWKFSANQGDGIIASIAEVPGPTTGDDFRPQILLYAPSGKYVTFVAGAQAGQFNLAAPETGEYTLLVSDGTFNRPGDKTGDYIVRLVSVPAESYVPAGDEGGRMVPGTNPPGRIELGDLDGWKIRAIRGDRILVSISEIGGANTGDDFRPQIMLYGPDGKYLTYSAGEQAGKIDWKATQTGDYTLIASDGTVNRPGDQTGDYRLTLDVVRPPLLFIPGIAGSTLELAGVTLWPSITPAQLLALDLEKGLPGVRAIDVFRSYAPVPGMDPLDIYGSLLDHLTLEEGYVEFPLEGNPSRMTSTFMTETAFPRRPSLFLFPYDWRRSNADHAETLSRYLSRIGELHGGAPVSALVHSMGGLVLRRLLLEYGAMGIDKVVTVGTPYWGAPVAIERVLHGNFYQLFPLDWINNDSFKRSLATFPGFHELLPTVAYFGNGGLPVFTELGRDLNGNKVSWETYSTEQFYAFIDSVVAGRGVAQVPSVNSVRFHTYARGRQDDASSDGAAIEYLQIAGRRRLNDTVIEVQATAETHFSLSEMDHVLRYSLRRGPGDGTVPLLSAERVPGFRNPRATVVRLLGGLEVGHNEMMSNPKMWELLHRFLAGESLAPASSRPALANPDAEVAVPRRVTTVLGTGYLSVTDDRGNRNTRLSELVARRIPDVAIQYGGEENWLEISSSTNALLTVDSVETNRTIQISVADEDHNGATIRLWRFRVPPTPQAWRLSFEGGVPEIRVDADGSGAFETAESLRPTYENVAGSVDTQRPTLSLHLESSGSNVIVVLAGDDNSGRPPMLRVQQDGGTVEAYSAPLVVSPGRPVALKVFAEDDTGNTSGMIEATIHPSLSTHRVDGSRVELRWPASDAHVLEASASPGSTWNQLDLPITRSNAFHTVTVSLSRTTEFFRLRSTEVRR